MPRLAVPGRGDVLYDVSKIIIWRFERAALFESLVELEFCLELRQRAPLFFGIEDAAAGGAALFFRKVACMPAC